MTLYREKSETVRADQWFRLGDDPQLVKAYERDEVHPDLTCDLCSKPIKQHGWIDPPLPPLPENAAPVDPVTGKAVAPPKVPAPSKSAAPVKPVKGSAAKAEKDEDDERGDLEGLVICPGNWVITHADGEHESITQGELDSRFERA